MSTTEEKFVAQERLRFEGFLKSVSRREKTRKTRNAEGILPPLKIGEALKQRNNATERFTYHPPRYTEATRWCANWRNSESAGLPPMLRNHLHHSKKRNYVVKEDRDGVKRNFSCLTLKNRNIIAEEKSQTPTLKNQSSFPTDIGMVVKGDFLMDNFKDIMDFNFSGKGRGRSF